MNKKSFIAKRRSIALVAVLAAPLVYALAQPTPSAARDTENGMISSKTEQGYAFMSGGVGIEERNLMQQKAGAYDLDLSFADKQGHYLSDVSVVIDDQNGTQLVNSTARGPFFYIDLPTGKYDVKASFDNKSEEIKNLNISKDHSTKELLHWNLSDNQMS
ncbi:MAG: hypothetical protein ACTHLX_02885 [Candidatus Binatia bacterium]